MHTAITKGGHSGISDSSVRHKDIVYPVSATPLYLGYCDLDIIGGTDFRVANIAGSFIWLEVNNHSARIGFSGDGIGSFQWFGFFKA